MWVFRERCQPSVVEPSPVEHYQNHLSPSPPHFHLAAPSLIRQCPPQSPFFIRAIFTDKTVTHHQGSLSQSDLPTLAAAEPCDILELLPDAHSISPRGKMTWWTPRKHWMTVFCYAYGMYTFGDIQPTKPIGAGKVPSRLIQPFTLAELKETWGMGNGDIRCGYTALKEKSLLSKRSCFVFWDMIQIQQSAKNLHVLQSASLPTGDTYNTRQIPRTQEDLYN
ncbi:hypothetical protein BZA77DRAFT_344454 [Pyronema omphalodes]|nr:hypothetical protein BZA77DRAFT_344454 [Pyronema omphalodes]